MLYYVLHLLSARKWWNWLLSGFWYWWWMV